MNLLQEFDKQTQNLIQKGYPKLLGLPSDDFLKKVETLRDSLENLNLPNIDLEKGYLPFVIVTRSELLSTEKAMSVVSKEGKPGITKLYPHESKDFKIIDSETIPDGIAYLLIDIDRGKENINLPPSEALKIIREANRFPLTIDEGVAIVTHYPEFLMKNNCFSLLASRHPGDQRVPAIWINADKNPNLGWCWDGNPHTWLGSASGKERLGV